MLTDAALKHLRPKEKSYKVTDRDGMYALVSTKGSISFRLDYRMNGRRETVTFGKYGPADLSLARARELCIDARRAIKEGRSPAIEKQRAKRRLMEAKGFGELCTEQTSGFDATRPLADQLPFWRIPDTSHRLSPNQKQTRSRWPYLGLEKAAPLVSSSLRQAHIVYFFLTIRIQPYTGRGIGRRVVLVGA